MKSLKLRSVAPAMMMFGGSPIRVAVPPMLEAITSITTSGIGSRSSASASRKVTGTIEQDRRQVVEEGREQRRRPGEREDDVDGPALGELAGADRDVVVDAGLLRQVDEDHHSRQQADRVEVDRLDRQLLVVLAADEEDDDGGAEQRHLRPVDALARDHGEHDEECDYGYGHDAEAGRARPCGQV